MVTSAPRQPQPTPGGYVSRPNRQTFLQTHSTSSDLRRAIPSEPNSKTLSSPPATSARTNRLTRKSLPKLTTPWLPARAPSSAEHARTTRTRRLSSLPSPSSTAGRMTRSLRRAASYPCHYAWATTAGSLMATTLTHERLARLEPKACLTSSLRTGPSMRAFPGQSGRIWAC